MLIDPKAAKVRGVAKLTKKDARSSTGLFLLEGPQGLKEALNRPKLIVELFATEDAVERYPDLFERAESARIEVQLVSEPVVKGLTDTTTPQGVVAVCEQLHSDLEDIIAAKPRLVALLANIRDPGNAGTVLRAADAAGADANRGVEDFAEFEIAAEDAADGPQGECGPVAERGEGVAQARQVTRARIAQSDPRQDAL